MSRKNTIILTTLIILVLVGILWPRNNNTVEIDNNTDVDLSGLQIKFSFTNSIKYVDIPTIPENQSLTIKLTLPAELVEGSVSLTYIDKHGMMHQEIIEGYIEKGYKINSKVSVNSVNKDGTLNFKVK